MKNTTSLILLHNYDYRFIGKTRFRSVFIFFVCKGQSVRSILKIIEPHDQGISNSIESELGLAIWDTDDVITSKLSSDVTLEMHDAYFDSLSAHLLIDR
jgi:hypothetical protein